MVPAMVRPPSPWVAHLVVQWRPPVSGLPASPFQGPAAPSDRRSDPVATRWKPSGADVDVPAALGLVFLRAITLARRLSARSRLTLVCICLAALAREATCLLRRQLGDPRGAGPDRLDGIHCVP